MTFSSNAEEIRYYIRELLNSDGAIHSRGELFDYVRNHAPNGKTFTIGMLTGAIYSLTDDPAYTCPRRGWYQAASGTKAAAGRKDTRIKIGDPVKILEATKEELRQLTILPVVDLTAADLTQAKKIKKMMEQIDMIIKEYRMPAPLDEVKLEDLPW